MSGIHAPFSIADRSAIRAWQACEWVHPLTCGSGNRGDAAHVAGTRHRRDKDEGLLRVDGDGLYCMDCDYRQTWVPAICVQPMPRNPFAGFDKDAS